MRTFIRRLIEKVKHAFVYMKAKKIAAAFSKDGDYAGYLHDQIYTSLRKNLTSELNNRTVYLSKKMKEHLPGLSGEKTFLCVGCRNTFELDKIQETCGVKTVGLDLFSENPRIKQGDMHAMPFKDNCFDGLYACHSLEHSFDHKKVLREFVRVVKPGGFLVIEIPVVFTPSASDRWDAGSVDNLESALKESTGKIIFKEETTRTAQGRLKREARLMVQVKK